MALCATLLASEALLAAAPPRVVTIELAGEVPGAEARDAAMIELRSVDDLRQKLRLPLTREVMVPAGEWEWQAEGPGFVTVGWNVVPAARPGKRAVSRAKAVPACEASLSLPPRTPLPDRVQVVAPVWNTVYEVEIGQRARFQVPQGSFFLLTHRGGLLMGLDALPRTCQKGQSLNLELPAPPSAREHALAVALRLPDPNLPLADLGLSLRPAGGRRDLTAALPAAVVGMGPRLLALFPRVPASDSSELRLKHPKLRSLSHRLPTLGGGTTALSEQRLRPRATLEIPVHYEPARPHAVQEIRGYFCGVLPVQPYSGMVDRSECTELSTRQVLRPGLRHYSFPDLDTGQYLFNASIDGQEVLALGSWFLPFLAPEADAFEGFEPISLRERHVYGHLLEGGEAVAGFVQVNFREYERIPDLIAPTDEALLYHLYYFGHRVRVSPGKGRRLEAERDPEGEDWGLTDGVFLNVCTEAGGCQALPSGTWFVGEGRFDLEIGENSGVVVRVIEAQSREPIAGAQIVPFASEDGEVVQLYDGEVHRSSGSGWPGEVRTGSDGRARVRTRSGPQQIVVWSLDHEPRQGKAIAVDVPAGDWTSTEVALGRRAGVEGEVRFVFPDGRSVGRALLVVFAERGERRAHCSAATRRDGVTVFEPGCLENAVVVLLHGGATISHFRGADLARGGSFRVAPLPSRSARVRVVGADGTPRAGASVLLVYDRFTLEAADFSAAYNLGAGPLLVGPADAQGFITLRGVDLRAGQAPAVAIAGDPRSRPKSLSGLALGGTLEVVVP